MLVSSSPSLCGSSAPERAAEATNLSTTNYFGFVKQHPEFAADLGHVKGEFDLLNEKRMRGDTNDIDYEHAISRV